MQPNNNEHMLSFSVTASQRQTRQPSLADDDLAMTAPPSRNNPRYDPNGGAGGGHGGGGGGGGFDRGQRDPRGALEEEARSAKKNVEVGSFLGGGSLDIDDEDAFLYGEGQLSKLKQ